MSVLGILGVVHDDNLRQKYNLPLEYIKELILEFEPDVICGEVLPLSWEQYSFEFDLITREKYEWLEKINPQSHHIRWTCRHLIMIQRIKNAISKYNGQRILCIVGADHNYKLYDEFKELEDVQLVYPLGT